MKCLYTTKIVPAYSILLVPLKILYKYIAWMRLEDTLLFKPPHHSHNAPLVALIFSGAFLQMWGKAVCHPIHQLLAKLVFVYVR